MEENILLVEYIINNNNRIIEYIIVPILCNYVSQRNILIIRLLNMATVY